MTNKFLVYDLNEGRFIGQKDSHNDVYNEYGNNLSYATLFTDETAFDRGISSYDTDDYLFIPMTQDMADKLPFTFDDTAYECGHSEDAGYAAYDMKETALAGDFLIMTPLGFYGQKFNHQEQKVTPMASGFELTDATVYNMSVLEKMHAGNIVTEPVGKQYQEISPILIPISDNQLSALQKLPEFNSEKNPFQRLSVALIDEQKDLSLGDALMVLQDNLEMEI